MTNDQINELVARKLGYKPRVVGFVDDPIEGDPGQRVALYQAIPDYCHDIQAAWELVDKIEWFCLERNHATGQWSVWDMAGTEEAQCICEADTAPMAICLAFLKLKDFPASPSCEDRSRGAGLFWRENDRSE